MEAFLKKFITKDGKEHTHTKIGSPKLNISGGSYCIPPTEMDNFYKVYKTHVFNEGKQAYLTEKQLADGPILIDVDFRYSPEIEERQHTKSHVIDLLQCILECINKIKANTNAPINCYVFEKDNVNMLEKVTKDGIHIMIDLQMDMVCKILLRNMIIKEIPDIWDDLKVINSWDEVFDDAVMKGHANWQMFGSRKPGNEDYKLKYRFSSSYTESWNINEVKILTDWVLENFAKLTARNNELVTMPLNPAIQSEYDMMVEKRKKPVSKHQVKLLTNISNTKQQHEVTNQEELDEYIDDFMSNLTATEYTIKEAHAYTMMLPQEYWGPGSYTKWMKVGWALKNTDNRLFISWLKFSSQSSSFDYSELSDLYEKWCSFDTYNKEGLTLRSIIYWCKMSNEVEYKKIHSKTIQHYVYYSIKHNTDYDLATVLYQLFKDSFICVNIKNNIWYEFINNRWQEIDCGHSLRAKISVDMYEIYHKEALKKQGEKIVSDIPVGEVPKNFNDEKDDLQLITKTATMLKKTSSKNTIMNEAKEIFYDKNFYAKLNTNNYLLGCNNCIIDFENKCHRKGKHDDYISKTTNIDYKPLSYYQQKQPQIIEAIHKFMSELFPEEELKEYMWQHLSSTLLGTNENQTINMYTGSGANGKSMLVDLMSKVLGQYKGTVPITLITQKRTTLGGTSSEIFQLIGVRYAVMQEPSIGDELNEGILKELTGGDPIQCRELFQTSTIFIPQFKLAVATNKLPGLKARDDGSWRRMRVVEFKSKFTKNPYKDPQFPIDQYPHQYIIDTKLSEKFDMWAPVMLSMLTEYAFKFQGKVHDCDSVMTASNKYREEQNVYLEYMNERIIREPTISGSRLKITVINDDFKEWYKSHYDKKDVPIKELKEFLVKHIGAYPTNGWSTISLSEEEI